MKTSLPQPPSSVRAPLRGIMVAGLAITLLATGAQADGNPAADILKMTGGARVRIVWFRGTKDLPKDHISIAGFDTGDGRERIIVPDVTTLGGPFSQPKITPSGKRVIFSERPGGGDNIFVIDWDGKNRKPICAGEWHLGVAEDPPGTEWVYVNEGGKAYRRQIDKPSVRELVWDKSALSPNWALTRDGKLAATGVPWPTVGVVELPNGAVRATSGGCGEGIAPDGLHFFHFRSDHKGVYVHGPGGPDNRYISFGDAPGVEGNFVHYPRWASYDPRFFTVTGPQAPDNRPAHVLFGQFNDSFTAVVKWVKVTDGPSYDVASYAWIAPKGFSDATSLVSGLTVKSLGLFVKRLDQGGPVRPILEELRRLSETAKEPDKAAEAKAIIAHVNEWGKGELERAKGLETQVPADAEKTYKNLVARFEGLEPAKAAQQRLQDKPFQDDLKSWAFVERMQAAEKRLKDVPGAGHTATDPKFARANSVNLGQIKTAAQTLAQQGASPWIVDEANAVLERLGIEPKIEKRAAAAPAAAPAAAVRPTGSAAGT